MMATGQGEQKINAAGSRRKGGKKKEKKENCKLGEIKLTGDACGMGKQAPSPWLKKKTLLGVVGELRGRDGSGGIEEGTRKIEKYRA